MSGASFPAADRKSDVLCGVCLKEISPPAQEKLTELKCHDLFHSKCIQEALALHQLKIQPCPHCRTIVYVKSTQPSLDAIKPTTAEGDLIKRPSREERRIYPAIDSLDRI